MRCSQTVHFQFPDNQESSHPCCTNILSDKIMDKEETIRQLYGTAHLDLLPALKSLVQDTQNLLKEDFSVENIHTYCQRLSVLKSLIACLTDLPVQGAKAGTGIT